MNATPPPSPINRPWEVPASEFPYNGTPADKLRFLLRYAVLAPSTHNSQPWMFHIDGDTVDLYLDLSRALRVTDPDDRQAIISCGAALCHLRIAMSHFGHQGEVSTFPEAGNLDLLARVRLGSSDRGVTPDDLLFQAILARRTNREAFTDDPVPEALQTTLLEMASLEGAWLHLVKDRDERNFVADLIARGDQAQWSDRRFRLELAAWVRSNRSTSEDGIPIDAYPSDSLLSMATPHVLRTFDVGTGKAATDRDIALYSPILAVLGTESDGAADWLAVGQALARVLLRARLENVYASFLNQPIEVASLRPKVRLAIGRAGHPQLILRMGYGPSVKATPRRGVESVLI
jgi:hypothetical protein